MIRSNHYEAAFEGYLQWHRLCYVAVNETRRSFVDDEKVKNLDFIVHGDGGGRLLIDVKGRRFPAGPSGKPRQVWECWTEKQDVEALLCWQEKFGPSFRALFVFSYLLNTDAEISEVPGDLWTWRGKRYVFRAIGATDYQRFMRRRSPKWETVCLRSKTFRRLARPFHFYTQDYFADEIPF